MKGSMNGQEKFLRLFNQAKKSFADGNYKRAAEKFKACTKMLPDQADARRNLGVTYERLGKFEEALKIYRSLEREGLDTSESAGTYILNALQAQAMALANSGECEKAILTLKECLELAPTEYRLYLQIGMLFRQINDFTGAHAAFLKYTTLCPKDATGYHYLCNLMVAGLDYCPREEQQKRFLLAKQYCQTRA